MRGIDLSRSDMTLTDPLFSSLIQEAEAHHQCFCQVHSQTSFAKREPGSYFNLPLNTLGLFVAGLWFVGVVGLVFVCLFSLLWVFCHCLVGLGVFG